MKIMRFLQMSDMAFSLGISGAPNSIEKAAEDATVCDTDSLERFTRNLARKAAYTTGVAALWAYREAMRNNLRGVEEADIQLEMSELSEDLRNEFKHAGRQLANQSVKLYPDNKILKLWCRDIKEKLTPGCYPIGFGLIFAAEGLSEESLFASLMYRITRRVLNESLKYIRVTEFDCQQILFKLTDEVAGWYRRARTMQLDDINSYAHADLFSAMNV